MVSESLIRSLILSVSAIDGVFMDPDALVEDAVLLSVAFPDEQEFKVAAYNTCSALEKIVDGRVASSVLKYNHKEWCSYHFQHRVAQGQKADMRVEWQPCDGGVRVRGFGHRWVPAHFYRRMSSTREE